MKKRDITMLELRSILPRNYEIRNATTKETNYPWVVRWPSKYGFSEKWFKSMRDISAWLNEKQ